MKLVLEQLSQRYPHLTYSPGQQFAWSPETHEIFYDTRRRGQQAVWSLLHETGHALLKHQGYQTDFQLLQLEVAAWEKARELATQLSLVIAEAHIQNCLDTYRNWLHARSICPTCTTKSLQTGESLQYRCHNCHTAWKVTPARFARPYRTINAQAEPIFLA